MVLHGEAGAARQPVPPSPGSAPEAGFCLGKGRPADGNDRLVERAVTQTRDLDRDLAMVEETEKLLCLPS